LLHLLDRNRLALVVLAGSLAAGARSRARDACLDTGALRWLARNARTVRGFLLSLSMLGRCARRAGYRALGRARPSRRLLLAPRRLLLAGRPLVPRLARTGRRADARLIAVPARL
jgi:hypothetical protein